MSANSALLPSAARQNEPSMEEILASIRRIISDDTPAAQKDGLMNDAPQNELDDDILDLAEAAITSSHVAPSPPSTLEPSHALASLEHALGLPKSAHPAPVPAPAQVRVIPPAPAPPSPPAPLESVSQLEDRILSQETGAVVSQAIQSLARQTAAPVHGRSMEDVVLEALRPVLRNWLDDHLPGIVERLVRAEIERVTRVG